MENIFYEHPENLRPKPPQGGSGVRVPVIIEFGEEFAIIISNLRRIENITKRISDNLLSVQKQLGKVNIDFCMQLENDDDDLAWIIKKQLLDSIKRGDIKFTFSPN